MSVEKSWYFLKGLVVSPPLLRGGFRIFVLSRCLNSSPIESIFFFTAKMESWVTSYKLKTCLWRMFLRHPQHILFQTTNHSLTHHRSPCLSAVSTKIRPQQKPNGGCSSFARGTSPARLREVYTSQVGLRKMGCVHTVDGRNPAPPNMYKTL